MRDESELRPLLGRDQREDGRHHPDPDERDRGDDEHDERGGEVRVLELEVEEQRDDREQHDRPDTS